MKTFTCECNHTIFFENTHCNNCQRQLGYDINLNTIVALNPTDQPDIFITAEGQQYRYCQNYRDFPTENICHSVIPADQSQPLCQSCALNKMIPNLSKPQNRSMWSELEEQKRRLVFTLRELNLPMHDLRFAFKEDQRTNPSVADEQVLTGHADGLITINIREADEVSREKTRLSLKENYRTILGHFRHETGHFYFFKLFNENNIHAFRQLFGDETQDYAAALKNHYSKPQQDGWQDQYISFYAQSHPHEDWAESWSHYLHIIDTMETANNFQFTRTGAGLSQQGMPTDFNQLLTEWIEFSIALNELNRSMGMHDAYPFAYNDAVREKLRFVHQSIKDYVIQSNAMVNETQSQSNYAQSNYA